MEETTENKNTEIKILEAAQEVFIQKGLDGSRMQEIADTAGINKSLLHYYYRTKDKLFLAVFKMVIKRFLPVLLDILNSDLPFFDKIYKFSDFYMKALRRNQFLPMFIIHEINRHPEKIIEVFQETGITPDKFIRHVNKEIEAGNIIKINPLQLIVNLFSLCIFPVIGRPLLQGVFFKNDKSVYDEFLDNRHGEVPEFFINAIKIKKV